MKLFRATTRNLRESPPRPWHPAVSLYISPPGKRANREQCKQSSISPCQRDPSQGPAARSMSSPSPSFPASVFCLLMAQSSTFRFVKTSNKQPRPRMPAQRLREPSTRNVLRERFQHGLLASHGGTNSRRTQGVAVLGVLEAHGCRWFRPSTSVNPEPAVVANRGLGEHKRR